MANGSRHGDASAHAGEARGESSGLIDLDALVARMNAAEPAIECATEQPATEVVASASRPFPRRRRSPLRTAGFAVVLATAALVLALVGGRARSSSPNAIAPVCADVLASPSPPTTRSPPSPAAAEERAAPPPERQSQRQEPRQAPRPVVAAVTAASSIARSAPSAVPAATVALADLPPSPAPAGDDLGAAIRRRAGHDDAPPAMPTSESNAPSTLRPAAGALNAAIAVAVRHARGCLAADDPTFSGTLTFGSDGKATPNVGDVVSSMPDARTCVTAALSHARVAPFTEAPLSVPVIVRP